jgi:hypothetical protein
MLTDTMQISPMIEGESCDSSDPVSECVFFYIRQR